MEYEARLRALGKPTLAELKGTGGLLAVTEEELIFLDSEGVHRLALASIRRIQKGEAGKILVMGEGKALEIPLGAFSVGELKAFLEGLKTHVARARKLLAVASQGEERAASQGEQQEKTEETSPPVSPSPPPFGSKAERGKTRAEFPKAPPQPSLPSEEETRVWVEETPPKAQPLRRQNPLALSSRLLALLSLAYGLGFALLNPADLWIQLGVLLASLNFFVLLWGFGSSSSS